jgi:hypothetical protein
MLMAQTDAILCSATFLRPKTQFSLFRNYSLDPVTELAFFTAEIKMP